MENIKTIKIDEELCRKIEALQFETRARQDLIAFMLDGRSTNSVQFDTYHAEYINFHREYEKAKEELTKKYIPQGTKRWELDFASCEVKMYA